MHLRKTLLFLLFLAFSTFAQTNISGTISSDSTLTAAGSPYIVTGSVTVASGVTLTVEANVQVRFNNGTRLLVLGALNASDAIFTSTADTVGGTPDKGDWNNIRVGDDGHYANVTFVRCQIRYGGGADYSSVYIDRGTVTLSNSEVSNSLWDGIKFSGRNPSTLQTSSSSITNCNTLGIYVTNNTTVRNTNISINNCEWPIRYDGAANVIFNGTNDLTGNTHDGILIYNNNYDSMTWDTVSVPYVIRQNFTINEGETLTIAPTNVVKVMSGRINVKGTLHAVAGVGEKIYFTSYKDDNLFGDTNGDFSTSSPHSGDWYGIYFYDQSNDTTNIMRRCEIRFAGRGYTGAITTDNASPTIDSCAMNNNYYGAMFVGLSNPVFSNNEIGSSQMVPVAMSFEANPVFTNNSFSASDNQYDAIGILGGTLRGNASLIKRDFTTVSNVTYLLLGSVTVPSGMTLTIDPGIVIKSYYYNHRLIVKGKLVAQGTSAEPIVFTAAKDDAFGNPRDTNKDGTNSVPAIGNWGGITFENGSDPTSIMDHCIVKFGYLPYWTYNINNVYVYSACITLINSSPTITNTKIKDVDYGIDAFAASNPTISNCLFENSKYTPIIMSANANPMFSGDSMTNAGLRAIGINGEHLPVNATISKRNFAGFTNITYALMGNLYINSGANVTVDPGVVIKPWNQTSIFVEGGFKASGTATDNIVFTSIKDDNKGNPGDTNGDGDASSPASNDWGTINFKSTSDDAFSSIDHCLIKFSGWNYKGGVTYTDAAAPMSNTVISDSYFGVRCEGSSTPNISSTTFQNCDADPIAMSLKANPTFTGITFSANGSSGIRILEGTLSSDATLAKRSVAGFSNIAYIVEYLTISPNATLTIEPGVVIKFNQVCCNDNQINVQGGLVAEGNATERIVFTSIKDDSKGGDTNNDGGTSSPAKGDWKHINFVSSALDTVNSLKYCDIRYGGSSSWISSYDAASIKTHSANLKIDNCVIEQSPTAGIGIYGSASPVISNSQITNITNTPINMSMFSNPTFINNTALNVGIMALGIKPEKYSVDGSIPIRNFGGFTNITYYLYGTSTVNSGTRIDIPAGVVFKGGSIDVKGALSINGTAAAPVVFTDLRDDMFGNPMDTNGDGTSTKPQIGGTRIKFYDVSDDANSTFNNAIFKYSDVGITLVQASPTFNNLTFNKDNWGLYLTGVSNPVLNQCTFDDLTYAPFRTSLVSYPAVTTGNVIKGSTYRAIGVLDNETLVQDVTLTKRNFAGVNNIPYLFARYTIASNAILTIEPGVVVKFFQGGVLTVKKGLQAIGGASADSTIVFTDIRDDYYGGDTNADSTDSTPLGGSNRGWQGIHFEDESNDPLCQLTHTVIRFAGYYDWWGDRGAIVTNNASPTISHSVFKNNYQTLVAKGSSNPTINYCDIYQNESFGVNNVDKSFTINAEYNWWGSNSGPTHSTNPGGTGTKVTDGVDFTPWLGAGASNPIMGDVSLNGSVQAFDASKILKYTVNPTGPDSLNELQRSVADVSGAGGITAYDASLILQYSVGLISYFPVEASAAPAAKDPKTKQYLALQKVTQVGLQLTGTTVKRGESFSVPVSIGNVAGVTALQIEMNIDNKLYSLQDVTLSDEFSNFNMNYFLNKETHKLIIAIAGADIMKNGGEVLKLNFTANRDIRGNHAEALEVTKFLANETDFTQNVNSESIEFIGKPTVYKLEQNYPNPFNPSTVISYKIPDDNVGVTLVIYNIQGKKIKTLVNGKQNAGVYKITWNATNDYGERVSTGIYIYRLITEKYTSTKKMIVLK